MLVDNPAGNFQFLKGIGPFSSGVVAHSSYEIVHVTFHPLPPLQRGFELIERHLQRNKRPLNALCGMELRIEGVTFVVSGLPEVQLKESGTYDIISHGDTSTAGLRKKAEHVLQGLTARLQGLQVTWAEVTTVEVYTVHDLHPLLATTILPALQGANRHGIRWHYARPPVVEIECEMDVRGVHQEMILSGR